MSKCESHEIHILGLQATLTNRNKRIAELEEKLSNRDRPDAVRQELERAYNKGWKECAERMMSFTHDVARQMHAFRKDAFKLILEGERADREASE